MDYKVLLESIAAAKAKAKKAQDESNTAFVKKALSSETVKKAVLDAFGMTTITAQAWDTKIVPVILAQLAGPDAWPVPEKPAPMPKGSHASQW